MTSSTDSSAHLPGPKEPLPKLSELPGVFPCVGCGRILRPQTTRAKDYPGIPRVRTAGKCHRCENVPEPKPEKTLTCEGGCGKLLRRNGLLLADYPGTQVVVARRRCYRCYSQGDYAEGGESSVPDYETHEETWIRTRVPDDLVHYFGIEV